MSYEFLENKNWKKYLVSFVEHIVEIIILIYLGLHNNVSILSTIFYIYFVGIALVVYCFGIICMILSNKEIFLKSVSKQDCPKQSKMLLSGIQTGIFFVWMMLVAMGILSYSSKFIILYSLIRLILPLLILIIREIKARLFGFTCYAELLLLNNRNYGDYHKVDEYRNIYGDLLTVTSIKDNPKVFRKLASQYESYINGYYE